MAGPPLPTDKISGQELQESCPPQIDSRTRMNRSPWSYFGRGPVRPEIRARVAARDPGSAGALPVANNHEKVAAYLQGTFMEYSRIRSGPAGYRRLIEAVLEPPPCRETIQDTLNRLAHDKHPRVTRDPSS